MYYKRRRNSQWITINLSTLLQYDRDIDNDGDVLFWL